MGKQGIFARYGDKFYSRDYKLVIPCEFEQCQVNKSKHCSMPSAIKISSGGFCQTGRDLIKSKIEKIDGD